MIPETYEGSVSATPANPGDTFATTSRAIYVGSDGNLSLRLVNDSSLTLFVGVRGGSVYPFRAVELGAATTATPVIVLN